MRAIWRVGLAMVVAGLMLGPAPALAQAAPDTTAAPPPADTVGPRELQNFRTANRLEVRQTLRVFDVNVRQITSKLVDQAHDVTRDQLPSERHHDARTDFCLRAQFGI